MQNLERLRENNAGEDIIGTNKTLQRPRSRETPMVLASREFRTLSRNSERPGEYFNAGL